MWYIPLSSLVMMFAQHLRDKTNKKKSVVFSLNLQMSIVHTIDHELLVVA
jgi:hypothetical protein